MYVDRTSKSAIMHVSEVGGRGGGSIDRKGVETRIAVTEVMYNSMHTGMFAVGFMTLVFGVKAKQI